MKEETKFKIGLVLLSLVVFSFGFYTSHVYYNEKYYDYLKDTTVTAERVINTCKNIYFQDVKLVSEKYSYVFEVVNE